MTREKWIVAGVALALFGVCAFESVYIGHLRSKCRRDFPAVWAMTPYDGQTNLLSTWRSLDAQLYMSKVNQIRLHGYPCNPFYLNHRGWRESLQDALSFYLVALLTAPFKNLGVGFSVVCYFLVAAWFLVLYELFRNCVAAKHVDPWIIAFGALLVVASTDWWLWANVDFTVPNLGKYLSAIINIDCSKWRGIQLMRLPGPVLTFGLLTIWFRLLIHAVGRQSIKRGVLVGLAGSLFFFIHFYEWTFILGLLAVQALATTVSDTKRFTILTLGAMMAGILPFMALEFGQTDPSVLVRAGITHGFHFDMAAILPFAIGMMAIFRGHKRGSYFRTPFLCVMAFGCVAGALLMNSDILLRFEIQKRLWNRETNLVMVLMLVAWFIQWLGAHAHSKIHAKWGIAALFGIMFLNQKSFAERYFLSCALPKSWENAFTWINANTPKDAQFLTLSSTVMRMLPTYTHATVLVGDGFPPINGASTQENLDRLATTLKTLGVSPKDFYSRWPAHGTHGANDMMMGWNPIDKGSWSPVLGHINPLPWAIQSAPTLSGDYYVWRDRDDPLIKPRGLLVYRNDAVEIYQHDLP